MNEATSTRAADRRAWRRLLSLLLECSVTFLLLCCMTLGRARAEPSTLPPEVGYNYAETATPHSGALGGAHMALSNAVDALFINPANMAVARVYHLAALVQILPQARRQSY